MSTLGRPLDRSIFEEKVQAHDLERKINENEFIGRRLTDEKKTKPTTVTERIKADLDVPDYLKATLSGLLTGAGQATTLPFQAQPPDVGELFQEQFPFADTTMNRIMQRAGRLAPMAFLGRGSLAGKIVGSLLGAAGGETAKELGFGDIGQAVAENIGLLAGQRPKGMTVARGQEKFLPYMQEMGLTEQEIAPALTPKGKGNFLSKFVSKRGRTQRALQRTRTALGRSYEKLKALPEAESGLNLDRSNEIFNKIESILSEIPASQRNAILEDFNNFANKPITGKSLINFQTQLNDVIPTNRQLGRVLGVMQETANEISPRFGNNLQLTNELYGNYATLFSKLKPTIKSDVIEALNNVRKSSTLLYSIYSGNYPLLLETLGEQGAKVLAREMLINPKFKNLTRQFIKAASNNKTSAIARINQELLKEVNKKISDETTLEKN